jgi:hypothetical protein
MTGQRAGSRRSRGASIEVLRQSGRWGEPTPRTRQHDEPVLARLAGKTGTRDVSRRTGGAIGVAMAARRAREKRR